VVSFMSQPLYPQRKSSQYPLGMRLGGTEKLLDVVAKRKILNPSGEANPSCPGHSLVSDWKDAHATYTINTTQPRVS